MWSDIWNVSDIELRSWNQVSYDHRSYKHNFKQLRIEAWKSQDFNGVWTRDLAIPVRRSNQLSYEATEVGSWSFVSSNEPVKWYMKWTFTVAKKGRQIKNSLEVMVN